MGTKPLAQARVEPETESALLDYADQRDLTKSEAIRRLLKNALAAEGYNFAGSRSLLERIASLKVFYSGLALFLISALLWVPVTLAVRSGDYAGALLILGVLGLFALASVFTLSITIFAQLALARPLRGLVRLPWGVRHER